MTTDHLLIVASNPVAGRENAFHEWYQQHVIDSVQLFPGFIAGQRYGLTPNQSAPSQFSHLAIYRIEQSRLHDAQRAIADIKAERAAAVAAGRTPVHPASEAMAEPHYGWSFSPLGDSIGPWFPES